ncbi:unnamed protein product [Nippostrongylus brasiliensis]|uniref:Reverse transcriptase domain-containing protein n=1 Tax=Nippostrongylus brasiliensis TaxID=27835 RepID=A0A0N4YGZ0_NIPBR|nr:unnamed protein product [Nippostrongylus brasiliensis]
MRLLREDFEAGEEELPIVGEVEVVTHHDENDEYFVENPVEPPEDTNNELLNGLETISKVLDHASIQKLKDFDSYLRDLIPDATAATNELCVKKKKGLERRAELPAVGGLSKPTPIRLLNLRI